MLKSTKSECESSSLAASSSFPTETKVSASWRTAEGDCISEDGANFRSSFIWERDLMNRVYLHTEYFLHTANIHTELLLHTQIRISNTWIFDWYSKSIWETYQDTKISSIQITSSTMPMLIRTLERPSRMTGWYLCWRSLTFSKNSKTPCQ